MKIHRQYLAALTEVADAKADRPALTGIHFDSLRAVAADGFILGIAPLLEPPTFTGSVGFDASTIRRALRFISKKHCEIEIVEAEPGKWSIEHEDMQFRLSCVPPLPDYSRRIHCTPVAGGNKVILGGWMLKRIQTCVAHTASTNVRIMLGTDDKQPVGLAFNVAGQPPMHLTAMPMYGEWTVEHTTVPGGASPAPAKKPVRSRAKKAVAV